MHANWAFTAPGRYLVTFEASATVDGGGFVSTGNVTYTFDVEGAAGMASGEGNAGMASSGTGQSGAVPQVVSGATTVIISWQTNVIHLDGLTIIFFTPVIQYVGSGAGSSEVSSGGGHVGHDH
jgi:surface-anchored protein